jgi:hypothetical protein
MKRVLWLDCRHSIFSLEKLLVENNSSIEGQSQKQLGTHLFGEKSKLANWVLNHPFHVAMFLTLIGCSIAVVDKATQIPVLIKYEVVIFGMAFFLRFYCRNLCYRVEIDRLSEKIKFYRCFNKGVVEAPLHSVEFVFDKHFACYYAGERFTIFNEYMADIAEVLPPEMDIRFAKGLYARFMKKQVEKTRLAGTDNRNNR